MNKIYKLVWNAQRQAFIVTSEKAQSKSKLFFTNLLSITTLTLASISISYAQCIDNLSDINTNCQQQSDQQPYDNHQVSQQTPKYFQYPYSITNLNNSVEITLPNHIESNDDGYDYSSSSDVDNLTVNQPAGEIIGGKYGININHNGKGSTNLTISGSVIGKTNAGIQVTHAIDAQDLNITELVGANIHGQEFGIQAINNGRGVTTITTSESVIADKGIAINVENNVDTKGLNITQSAGVIHGILAIRAMHNGKGSLNISTSGEVISDSGDGVYGINNSNASDITIGQYGGSIKGALNGIFANNAGNGSTTITTAGNITAQTQYGIFAHNDYNTHDLTVTQSNGHITSQSHGMKLENYGNGSTVVTTSGDIISQEGDGILIDNLNNTKKLTFNQLKGSITGYHQGINLIHTGNDAMSITANGDIIGQQSNGIAAFGAANTQELTINQLKGNIIGSTIGIFAQNGGTNSTLITTSGNVTGQNLSGISVQNNTNTHDITINQASGTIHGNLNGIETFNMGNGTTLITTAGEITSSSSSGIYSINYNNAKDINLIQSLGNISGKNYGVYLDNNGNGSSSITVAGNVTGSSKDGLFVNNHTNTKNLTAKQSSGMIQGKENGINYNNSGNGSTYITTSGSVSGEENDGIYAINDIHTHDLNVMQTKGSINGYLNGINIQNKGSGSTSIISSGDVVGSQKNGIHALNDQSSTNFVVSQTSGLIKGLIYGVYIENNGTGSTSINTSGDIVGGQEDGLYAVGNDNTQEIKIGQLDGNITGSNHGINILNNGQNSSTITTLGKVNGLEGHGINAINNSHAKDLTVIQSSGEINGKLNGIKMLNNGTRSTLVSIASNVTGNSLDGVEVIGQSSTNNLIFGQIKNSEIKGYINGVNLLNNGQGSTGLKVAGKINSQTRDAVLVVNDTNTNNLSFKQEKEGNIEGALNGVYLTNQGRGFTHIVNEGSILSNGGNGIFVVNKNLTQSLKIESSGNIKSFDNGINALNEGKGFTSLLSSSNITANMGSGILLINGGTATDMTINQLNGVISGFDSGIKAINNGTGFTQIDISGKVISQDNISGNGIYTSGKENAKTYINLNQGADVSSANNIAIRNESTDSIVSLNNGSKVSGEIRLGSGNDTLIMNQGADISALTIIDGSEKKNQIRRASELDTLILNLHLTGSSTSDGAINNVAIYNWEDITLKNTGRLTLTGDLNTNKLTLESGAVVDLHPSLHQVKVNGNVYNGGTITLSNTFAGDNMTISGDYIGNNGKLILDTVVQDSNSPTDKLIVNGNTSGNTFISINNVNGLGADTGNTNGIEVVHVDGTSTNDAFSIENQHIDVGAYEYILYKGDINKQNNNWYLRSFLIKDPEQPINPDNPTNPENPTNPTNPDNPNNPDNHTEPTDPIIDPDPQDPNVTPGTITYRKEVPMFAAIPALLRQADNIMQGNMHQRIGNTPFLDSPMTWGRFINKRINLQQSGIANAHSKGNYTGLQLGSDILQNKEWRMGAYFGYLRGDLSVDGFASGKNGRVGSNKIDSYFLGAYGTYMQDNGTYVDIVLQGAHHHTDVKPNGNKNSKQKGYGFSASIETGKPFNLSDSGWKLEPQAQIIHQWLNLDDSHVSGNTKIKQSHINKWLFRVGGRFEGLFQTETGILRPYARANLFYSPNGADRINFASQSASTKFSNGAKYLSSEIALGGSYELNNQMSIYTEVGHTWTNGGKARVKAPFSSSIGIKANW